MTPQRRIEQLVNRIRAEPRSVRFTELERVCRHYFGAPRLTSGSHRVFKTRWLGDPRVNIQNDHGSAKTYQVKQVLAAIDRLLENETEGGSS